MPYDSSKQHLFVDGKINSTAPQNGFILKKNVVQESINW